MFRLLSVFLHIDINDVRNVFLDLNAMETKLKRILVFEISTKLNHIYSTFRKINIKFTRESLMFDNSTPSCVICFTNVSSTTEQIFLQLSLSQPLSNDMNQQGFILLSPKRLILKHSFVLLLIMSCIISILIYSKRKRWNETIKFSFTNFRLSCLCLQKGGNGKFSLRVCSKRCSTSFLSTKATEHPSHHRWKFSFAWKVKEILSVNIAKLKFVFKYFDL